MKTEAESLTIARGIEAQQTIGKELTMAVNIAEALTSRRAAPYAGNLALTIGENSGASGLGCLVPLATRVLQSRENLPVPALAAERLRAVAAATLEAR